jgi:hypothetical protein
MKADGRLDSGEISSTLNHLSNTTNSTSGHANMCMGRGMVLTKVAAARQARAAAKVKQSVWMVK